MKKLLLIGFIALFGFGFQSCKKSKKDEPIPIVPPPIVKNTYANSRIKEVRKNGLTNMRFIYDKTNKLITSRNMGRKFNPELQTDIEATISFIDYVYNANGKVIKETTTTKGTIFTDPDSPYKSVYDYTYNSNDILQSYTYSDLDTSNPDNHTKALVNTYKYTYNQNGQLEQITTEDKNGNVIGSSSYIYDATINGELKKIAHIVPPSGNANAFDATYIYYANIFDPNPLNLPGFSASLPLMLKSYQSSIGNTQVTYISDSDGNITSYTETYPNKPVPNTTTYTYLYEPKQ